MKGVDPLIGAILVIAISISAIIIIYQYANPLIERFRENFVYQEGLENLNLIGSSIREVSIQGNGSSKLLTIKISGGNYVVDNSSEKITFTMDSKSQIIGNGVSRMEDNINVTGYQNRIIMFSNYSNVDLISGSSFVSGTHTVNIKNIGFDTTTDKIKIDIIVQ
jgi:hypothetical protein